MQPVQGRKKGGGTKFGEMERDALIAHGGSMFLQDRLLFSSDYTPKIHCGNCKTFLFTRVNNIDKDLPIGSVVCFKCRRADNLTKVTIPYSLITLQCELASMNIAMNLET